MREITIKYHLDYRKHRYEPADKPKKQLNGTFIEENLVIKVIMDCKTTAAHKF